jgi:hypothetical protein
MPTGRVILFPEEGAPAGSTRKVVVTLPENPSVSLVIGPMRLTDGADVRGIDDAGATPQDIAEGRYFQWPSPAPTTRQEYELLPNQWLAALSQDGIADVTLYVEYRMD